MRILCVAEKPSQARAVVEILGQNQAATRNGPSKYNKNYDFNYRVSGAFVPATMTSVMGHISESNFSSSLRRWTSCNPATLFSAPVERAVNEKLLDVARNLKQEARTATHLYIWTDCDREGEAIGSEVAEVCKQANPRIIVKRAHFSSVLPQEIHHAMQNPRELDQRLVDAVLAREELDLRVGAALTRFQTLRLQSQFSAVQDRVISYGPCQFPTLGFVVDQFLRVEQFVPEPFWHIYLHHVKDEDAATFTWARRRLFDRASALALYAQCVQARVARVDSVRARSKEKWKPLPLTTVELQKCCARYLRMSPDKAMSVAEQLYNKGMLSYPRTETDQFDRNMDLRGIVTRLSAQPGEVGAYAQRLAAGGFVWPRQGRNNDKAHPPIHPVAAAPALQGDEKRLYEFVLRRFLACCSNNARGQATEIDISMACERFSANGLMVTERNYLEIYPYERWAESTVPVYQTGDAFEPTVLELRSGTTTAPKLLKYHDLIDAMDKNGIGTDATHADHIKKIIEREYIFKAPDDTLTPSTLGIGLKEGYDAIGLELSLCKPHLRREMERELKAICDGTTTREAVLGKSVGLYHAVYTKVVSEVDRLESALSRCLQEEPKHSSNSASANGAWTPQAGPENICPCPSNDGGTWSLRSRGGNASSGWMIGCSCYPQCRRSIWLPDSVASVSVSSANCPDCQQDPLGAGKLLQIRFRPGTTPPGVPAVYNGCVRGCDELINEMFDIRATRPASSTNNTVSGDFTAAGASDQRHGGGYAGFARADSVQSMHSARPAQATRSMSAQGVYPYTAAPPLSAMSSQGSNQQLSDSPLCNCGSLSVQRTVSKEGPNKGRTFYVCSKPQDTRCDFFQWTDQQQVQQSFQQQPSFASYQAAPETAKPKCKCGLYAAPKKTTKPGPNQGREFYVCTKTFQGCGFVCWKDEVEAYIAKGATSGGGGGGGGGGASVAGGSTCYKCGNSGHWARDCTDNTASRESVGSRTSDRQRGTSGGSRGRGRTRTGNNSRNNEFNDTDTNFDLWS